MSELEQMYVDTGIYHSKQEPVMVECVEFNRFLLYTQNSYLNVLPEVDIPEYDITSRKEFDGVL